MSEDKREEILVRLGEILTTVFGTGKSYRNIIDLPEKQRPAGILLDGDEETQESTFGRGRSAMGPNIIEMHPEIHIVLGDTPEKVGTELNGWRAKVIKAILSDASLVALTHNGDIRYRGISGTGLQAGRAMEATVGLNFALMYVLRPDKL